MKEEFLLIPLSSGKQVQGLLRKPNGDGMFSVVVIVSGFGMDLHEYKNSNDEVSRKLVDVGFATLQFNFSVVGTDRELSLPDRAAELQNVWEWVKHRRDIDTGRMDVHGTSFGVPTIMWANITDVKSFIFVSGVYYLTCFKKQFEGRGATIYYDRDTDLPRSSGRKTVVGPEFWPAVDLFNPVVLAKKIKIPTFMIHGDQDTKIDTKDVEQVFDAVASKKKKLKIFKGGDHGITDVSRRMREEFLADIVRWFKETL